MSIVVIDGAHLAFRAYHTFSHFKNSKDYPTGMIYGFLSILNSYASQFGSKVIVTWEGGDNWRKEIYPEYKMKRGELDEEISQGFKDLQSICTELGLLQIRKRGYEADDAISFVVRRFGKNIRIISGDKDLIQLIDSSQNVLLLRPSRDRGLLNYNEESVIEEFNVPKKDFIKFLAIWGDKSDNIIGIHGMGKVKTAKLINNGSDPIAAIKEMYPSHADKIDLNLTLIDLLDRETMIRNLEPEDVVWKDPDLPNLVHKFHFYEIKNFNPKSLIESFYSKDVQTELYDELIRQVEYRY
jgi:5'-3' exonuclease